MQTQLLAGLLTVSLLTPTVVTEVAGNASDEVVAVHERMLGALDRGDVSGLRSLMSDAPTLFVLDQNAQPVTLTGSLAAQSYLSLWARDIEDPEPTKLLSCSVVSESSTSTVVVLEFERPMTDVRLFRATSILVSEKKVLVADGVGGHFGGGRASKLAAETMLRHVAGRVPESLPVDDLRDVDVEQQMCMAIEHCQARIDRVVEREPEFAQMGTTLTASQLLWPRLCVGHVGDSRCYLLRGGKLQQLTTDHTVAQRRIDAGEWSAHEAHDRGADHRLWNALCGLLDATPQVLTMELRPYDTVLLCTDGLTDYVGDDEIRDTVLAARVPEEACGWLVQAAKNAGGLDNITVVVVRVPPAGRPSRVHRLDEATERGDAAFSGGFE